jgi:hypothetical protein
MRPGIRRHRPSSVDRLDPEIKRLISDLRIEHGWTIDEIHQKLIELKQPVSRSALARHTKSIEEIGAELRHSREMAKALVETAPVGDDAKLEQLNLELMHSMVLRLLTATNAGEMITLDPENTMFLARALGQLAGARKTDADRRRKDREEAKKEFLGKVEETAKKGGAGLTREAVDAIRHAVLGVD